MREPGKNETEKLLHAKGEECDLATNEGTVTADNLFSLFLFLYNKCVLLSTSLFWKSFKIDPGFEVEKKKRKRHQSVMQCCAAESVGFTFFYPLENCNHFDRNSAKSRHQKMSSFIGFYIVIDDCRHLSLYILLGTDKCHRRVIRTNIRTYNNIGRDPFTRDIACAGTIL